MNTETDRRLAIAVRCWFLGFRGTALAMLDLVDGAP